MSTSVTSAYRTRAPFSLNGGVTWKWHTWTSAHANKHAAVHAKANELGANAWDYGMTDHAPAGEASW